jgi:hypothetical protein
MKIAFAGCSHSTNMYGKSWANHMLDDLNCEHVEISVSGASNELLIEKIKTVLDRNSDVDYYIVQLSDPSRLTLGLYGNDPKKEHNKKYHFEYNSDDLCSERETNGISYITIKVNQNDGDINEIIDTNYKVIDFFNNHILISDYNTKLKIFHTLIIMKSLFDFYNKKCLFFSWAVDILELSKEMGYYKIIKSFNIVPGSIINFVKEKNLKKHLVDSTHYSTDGHYIFYNEFLKKHIYKFIKD